MKAIIPVAGVGTRLRPHTYTQPKPLIPVGGKPLIASIIDQLLEEHVDDFVFIIGYFGEKIKNFVEESYPDLKTTFVHQEVRMGLGHAMHIAADAYQDADEVLIVLGDTIFDSDLRHIIRSPYSCLAIKKVADPREFGVVELDEENFIQKVVEKPKIPKSNLAIVGLYKISEVSELIRSLNYIIENNIKTKEEFHLTDALMNMVGNGVKITVSEIENWYDCGKKEVLLATNEVLLKRLNDNSPVEGLENSIIVPPVSIGKGCVIKNSIIGPNVCIGENSNLNYANIRDSIIGSFANIDGVVLQESIIGSDASVKGLSLSLNIGENTEIDFS